jgi:hypothetical protein
MFVMEWIFPKENKATAHLPPSLMSQGLPKIGS